jgi:DNA polymerase-3 subunit gamma/tau
MKQAVSDFEGDDLYAPELLESLARALSPEDVQLYYQTAIVGRRDLFMAPEPRSGFEMTLLRMLAFRPAGDTGVAASAPQAPAASRSIGSSGPHGASAGSRGAGATRSAGSVASATGASADGSALAARTAPNAPPPGNAVDSSPDSWSSIVSQLDLGGAARQLANHCVLLGRRGAVVRLGLDPRNQIVRTPRQVDQLAQALSKFFGETVRVEFDAVVPGLETPAQAEQRATVEEFDSARQSLEADPAVRALREKFGATLLPDSVRPVNK